MSQATPSNDTTSKDPVRIERKQVLVGSPLQGQFITRLVIYWCIYHLTLWHGMFLLRYLQYWKDVTEGAARVPFAELYGEFVWQNSAMIAGAALIAPIILWDVILLTHRVAGPIVRLERVLWKMAQGGPITAIQFRKHDFVGTLGEAFNSFLNRVTTQPQATVVQTSASELGTKVGDVAAIAASNKDTDGSGALLHDLRDLDSSLNSLLRGQEKTASV